MQEKNKIYIDNLLSKPGLNDDDKNNLRHVCDGLENEELIEMYNYVLDVLDSVNEMVMANNTPNVCIDNIDVLVDIIMNASTQKEQQQHEKKMKDLDRIENYVMAALTRNNSRNSSESNSQVASSASSTSLGIAKANQQIINTDVKDLQQQANNSYEKQDDKQNTFLGSDGQEDYNNNKGANMEKNVNINVKTQGINNYGTLRQFLNEIIEKNNDGVNKILEEYKEVEDGATIDKSAQNKICKMLGKIYTVKDEEYNAILDRFSKEQHNKISNDVDNNEDVKALNQQANTAKQEGRIIEWSLLKIKRKDLQIALANDKLVEQGIAKQEPEEQKALTEEQFKQLTDEVINKATDDLLKDYDDEFKKNIQELRDKADKEYNDLVEKTIKEHDEMQHEQLIQDQKVDQQKEQDEQKLLSNLERENVRLNDKYNALFAGSFMKQLTKKEHKKYVEDAEYKEKAPAEKIWLLKEENNSLNKDIEGTIYSRNFLMNEYIMQQEKIHNDTKEALKQHVAEYNKIYNDTKNALKEHVDEYNKVYNDTKKALQEHIAEYDKITKDAEQRHQDWEKEKQFKQLTNEVVNKATADLLKEHEDEFKERVQEQRKQQEVKDLTNRINNISVESWVGDNKNIIDNSQQQEENAYINVLKQQKQDLANKAQDNENDEFEEFIKGAVEAYNKEQDIKATQNVNDFLTKTDEILEEKEQKEQFEKLTNEVINKATDDLLKEHEDEFKKNIQELQEVKEERNVILDINSNGFNIESLDNSKDIDDHKDQELSINFELIDKYNTTVLFDPDMNSKEGVKVGLSTAIIRILESTQTPSDEKIEMLNNIEAKFNKYKDILNKQEDKSKTLINDKGEPATISDLLSSFEELFKVIKEAKKEVELSKEQGKDYNYNIAKLYKESLISSEKDINVIDKENNITVKDYLFGEEKDTVSKTEMQQQRTTILEEAKKEYGIIKTSQEIVVEKEVQEEQNKKNYVECDSDKEESVSQEEKDDNKTLQQQATMFEEINDNVEDIVVPQEKQKPVIAL